MNGLLVNGCFVVAVSEFMDPVRIFTEHVCWAVKWNEPFFFFFKWHALFFSAARWRVRPLKCAHLHLPPAATITYPLSHQCRSPCVCTRVKNEKKKSLSESRASHVKVIRQNDKILVIWLVLKSASVWCFLVFSFRILCVGRIIQRDKNK